MAESLHCTPETITTLLIDYNPIQNKAVLSLGKRKKKYEHSKGKQVTEAYRTF